MSEHGELPIAPVEAEPQKRTLISIARDIAYKNKIPLEHALIWARMPVDVEAE